MRMYCLVALTLVVTAAQASADPLTVQILSTRYSTTVSNTDFLENGDPATTTQTQQSSSPLHDSLIPTYCCDVQASADFLSLDLYALAMIADVEATSVLEFVPTSAGVGTLTVDLMAHMHAVPYSQGLISLFNRTTNASMWSYSWGFDNTNGNLPWLFKPADADSDYAYLASWAVETMFSPDHEYALTMIGATQSRSDTEHLTMRVSGVHAVPEPASMLLVATGVALVGARRRRRRR